MTLQPAGHPRAGRTAMRAAHAARMDEIDRDLAYAEIEFAACFIEDALRSDRIDLARNLAHMQQSAVEWLYSDAITRRG